MVLWLRPKFRPESKCTALRAASDLKLHTTRAYIRAEHEKRHWKKPVSRGREARRRDSHGRSTWRAASPPSKTTCCRKITIGRSNGRYGGDLSSFPSALFRTNETAILFQTTVCPLLHILLLLPLASVHIAGERALTIDASFSRQLSCSVIKPTGRKSSTGNITVTGRNLFYR